MTMRSTEYSLDERVAVALKTQLLRLQTKRSNLLIRRDMCTDSKVTRCYFWASVHSQVLDTDAVAEIREVIAPRKVRVRPGNVEFQVNSDRVNAKLGAALASLKLVEYVYCCVLAFSSKTTSLSDIKAATEGVPWVEFSQAIQVRKLFTAAQSVNGTSKPPPKDHLLKFRVVSKRGGQHEFTSRDLKREVANSVAESPLNNLQGCFKDYDFDLMAYLHNGRFWLGLLINNNPLYSSQGSSQCNPYAAQKTQKKAIAKDADELTGWVKAKGVPRTVLDVVIPLHDMPYPTQLQRKEQEMAQVLLRMCRETKRSWLQCKQQKKLMRRRKPGDGTPSPWWLINAKGADDIPFPVSPIRYAM
jgi:hypothetical protein